MEDWVWWMIAAGVLAVGEIATLGFFLGPIAVAAVLAAIVAARRRRARGPVDRVHRWPRSARWPCCGRSPAATCAPRRASAPARPRWWAGRPPCSSAWTRDGGQVKIGGEVWTARAYDEDEVFEPGARVEVMKIDGATALVAE